MVKVLSVREGKAAPSAPQEATSPPLAGEAGAQAGVLDFDSMYRVHFPFVWRSLRRLGVQEASLDDAAQEVFLVVHRRFAEFRPGSSPKAWLFAIAQRVASDQRRWLRRKGGLLPLHEELATRAPGPLEHAMQSQASDIVLDFLDALDADRRAAFILSELEQMTAPEVASSVNANLNTVYYRIASARKAFAAFATERMKERGAEP